MRLGNVDQVEVGPVSYFFIDLLEGVSLTPKRSSGVAAKGEEEGPIADALVQVALPFAIDVLQAKVWEIVSGDQGVGKPVCENGTGDGVPLGIVLDAPYKFALSLE